MRGFKNNLYFLRNMNNKYMEMMQIKNKKL